MHIPRSAFSSFLPSESGSPLPGSSCLSMPFSGSMSPLPISNCLFMLMSGPITPLPVSNCLFMLISPLPPSGLSPSVCRRISCEVTVVNHGKTYNVETSLISMITLNYFHSGITNLSFMSLVRKETLHIFLNSNSMLII